MRYKFLFAALLTTTCVFAQTQYFVDSLANEICETITNDKDEQSDSVRVFKAFQKHRPASSLNLSPDEQQTIGNNIYFRLQRNCPLFNLILQRNAPQNKLWETVSVRPVSKLTEQECIDFRKYKNYSYRESSGDTVLLNIDNGFWIDHFKNGTYSKLTIEWLSGCEFDIEFVESNNEIRKNFSKAGDRYRYLIVEKSDTYYLMSVEILGQQVYHLFKIYY